MLCEDLYKCLYLCPPVSWYSSMWYHAPQKVWWEIYIGFGLGSKCVCVLFQISVVSVKSITHTHTHSCVALLIKWIKLEKKKKNVSKYINLRNCIWCFIFYFGFIGWFTFKNTNFINRVLFQDFINLVLFRDII